MAAYNKDKMQSDEEATNKKTQADQKRTTCVQDKNVFLDEDLEGLLQELLYTSVP